MLPGITAAGLDTLSPGPCREDSWLRRPQFESWSSVHVVRWGAPVWAGSLSSHGRLCPQGSGEPLSQLPAPLGSTDLACPATQTSSQGLA